MSLYAIAIYALQDNDEQRRTYIMANPIVMRHETIEDAERAALLFARDKYPESDGWHSHHAVAMNIEDVDTQRIWYEKVSERQEQGTDA